MSETKFTKPIRGGRMTIGGRIWWARQAAHMTQRQLSEKSGYTSTSISRWECGREVPSERAIAALEKALGTRLREEA